MMSTRRLPAWVAAATVGAITLAACGGEASGDGSEEVQLRYSWWGSDERAQITEELIEAFEEEHPHISVEGEYGDWDGYWDQLATQTAAQDAPDVIQMDEMYIREYADRGALLELTDVDVSNFDEVSVANGSTEDGLFGISSGNNSLIMVANPDLFDEAGVELPDDTTWTWEDYAEISQELSEGLEDGYGSASPTLPGAFQAWLRQDGKNLTTEDGELGFEAEDLAAYFEAHLEMEDDGGFIPAELVSETQAIGLDQTLIATNDAALGVRWSNELPSLINASGSELVPLRMPSQTGEAADAGLWYKSSQLMTASAYTDHPEEAQLFIDWVSNSEEAGLINLAERGLSANSEILELILPELDEGDRLSADFLMEIEDEIGEPEPVPPPGFGGVQDIFYRYELEVLFERQSPEDAAEALMDEVDGALG